MKKYYRHKSIVIGTKQTVKALKEGNVRELIVAKDADPKVTAKVVNDSS